MSSITIDIDRLCIGLHGISSSMAEAAVDGLDEELRRRLGTSFADQRAIALDISELAIGPLTTRSVLDSAALRGLIADRLLEALASQLAKPATNRRGND